MSNSNHSVEQGRGGDGETREGHTKEQPTGVSAPPDCGFWALSLLGIGRESVRDFSSYFIHHQGKLLHHRSVWLTWSSFSFTCHLPCNVLPTPTLNVLVTSVSSRYFAAVRLQTPSAGQDVTRGVITKVCRRTSTHTRSRTNSFTLTSQNGEVRVGEEGWRDMSHITSSKRDKCPDNTSWKSQHSDLTHFLSWVSDPSGCFWRKRVYILICLPFPRLFFPPEVGRQSSSGRAGPVGLWSRRRRPDIAQCQRQCPAE